MQTSDYDLSFLQVSSLSLISAAVTVFPDLVTWNINLTGSFAHDNSTFTRRAA